MSITITVRKNGSLGISAEDAAQITLVDHLGNVFAPRVGRGMSLCRCGASSTKPYCDSSHKVHGFIDPPDPVEQTDPADPADPAHPAVPAHPVAPVA